MNSHNKENTQIDTAVKIRWYRFLSATALVVAILIVGLLVYRGSNVDGPDGGGGVTNGAVEAAVLNAQVATTFLLQQSEIPTVATVVNVDKVKSQDFFKFAQNGDKVLIYTKNGRAILYRPATKQIIEVAPASQAQSAQQNN